MTEPTLTCPNGHENPEGSRFCETCGTSLSGTVPAEAAAPVAAAPARGGLSMGWVLGIAAIVAVGAAIATGGAVYLLTSGDDDDADADASALPTATITAAPATNTPTEEPTETPEPAATALPGTSRETALPIGVAKRRVDGWEVLVVRSDFDAVQEILAENSNNTPPKDGFTYAIVRLSATNREAEPEEGEELAEFEARAFTRLVDADGNEYRTFENDGCGVTPDGFAFLDNPQPVGGTVEGNICFHVPADIAAGSVLFDEVSDTWYLLR